MSNGFRLEETIFQKAKSKVSQMPIICTCKHTFSDAHQACMLGLGDIDFFVYHDTLGGYHDIPDILVEFKLLEIKVTLKLN